MSTNPLVVFASSSDPTGVILSSCIKNQIPFLHADVPDLNEISRYLSADECPRFQPTDAADLSSQIAASLAKKLPPPKLTARAKDHQKYLEKWLQKVLRKQPKTPATGSQSISVCIVFFDRPEFLKQSLVALEGLGNWISEILIYVNKASKPESIEFLQSLQSMKKKSKVRVVRGPLGLAPGHARNKMADVARSETLLFLDDDNVVDSVALAKLLQAGFNDWDVICCPLKRFDNDHLDNQSLSTARKIQNQLENITFAHWLPVGDDVALNILENKIGDCNLLAKRNLVLEKGGFNESLFYGEDQEFLVRSVFMGARYFLSPEPFVFYRTHGANLTKDVDHDAASMKLMNVILKGIGLESFTPAFELLRSSGFEVDKKAQFEKVRELYTQSNFYSGTDRDFGSFEKKAKSVFKNTLHADRKNGLLECSFLPEKSRGKVSAREPNRALEIVFFSTKATEISISDSRVLLNKGFTIATIRYNSRDKISVFGPRSGSFYIFKIRDALL